MRSLHKAMIMGAGFTQPVTRAEVKGSVSFEVEVTNIGAFVHWAKLALYILGGMYLILTFCQAVAITTAAKGTVYTEDWCTYFGIGGRVDKLVAKSPKFWDDFKVLDAEGGCKATPEIVQFLAEDVEDGFASEWGSHFFVSWTVAFFIKVFTVAFIYPFGWAATCTKSLQKAHEEWKKQNPDENGMKNLQREITLGQCCGCCRIALPWRAILEKFGWLGDKLDLLSMVSTPFLNMVILMPLTTVSLAAEPDVYVFASKSEAYLTLTYFWFLMCIFTAPCCLHTGHFKWLVIAGALHVMGSLGCAATVIFAAVKLGFKFIIPAWTVKLDFSTEITTISSVAGMLNNLIFVAGLCLIPVGILCELMKASFNKTEDMVFFYMNETIVWEMKLPQHCEFLQNQSEVGPIDWQVMPMEEYVKILKKARNGAPLAVNGRILTFLEDAKKLHA